MLIRVQRVVQSCCVIWSLKLWLSNRLPQSVYFYRRCKPLTFLGNVSLLSELWIKRETTKWTYISPGSTEWNLRQFLLLSNEFRISSCPLWIFLTIDVLYPVIINDRHSRVYELRILLVNSHLGTALRVSIYAGERKCYIDYLEKWESW